MESRARRYLRLFSRNAKLIYKSVSKRKVIINYQPGKVASSTVCRYFKINKDVFWHVHRFNNTYIHNKKDKNNILRFIDKITLKLFLMHSDVKIICGYRDPISRNIAMFFQTYEANYGEKIEVYDFDILKKRFMSDFPQDEIILWFDKEMKQLTGVDIFEHNFDREKGFQTFKGKDCSVFLYRMDKVNNLESDIATFFNDDNYKILTTNRSSDKWYHPFYSRFLSDISFDKTYLRKIYSSKVCMHLYTNDELQVMKSRWIK